MHIKWILTGLLVTIKILMSSNRSPMSCHNSSSAEEIHLLASSAILLWELELMVRWHKHQPASQENASGWLKLRSNRGGFSELGDNLCMGGLEEVNCLSSRSNSRLASQKWYLNLKKHVFGQFRPAAFDKKLDCHLHLWQKYGKFNLH